MCVFAIYNVQCEMYDVLGPRADSHESIWYVLETLDEISVIKYNKLSV